MHRATDPLDGSRTPDGRYLVVRGRLWRATNPTLSIDERTAWTRRLMEARRNVGITRRRGDLQSGARARQAVDRAKRALGERGDVWWDDGAPDYNRRLVRNTPYRDWYERLQLSADAILALLAERADDASICPSEVARKAAPHAWRAALEVVREAGRQLARQHVIVIRQRGHVLDPDAPVRGPIRYAKP